jgi:hypothetical protein
MIVVIIEGRCDNMASRIVVHIGLEKTGTTSIQRYLEIHALKLMKEGFLYPRAGRVGGGHHNLAFALGFSTLEADTHILDDLKVEIRRWPHQVILSSENFSIMGRKGGGKDSISALRILLEPLAEQIMVLIYYRPRQEWLRSLYIERKRWGLKQEFSAFCRDIVPVYEALPDVWRDAFPAATLVVRRYDRNHNVISDFTDLLGLPRFEQDKPHLRLHETPMETYKDEFGEHPEPDGNTGADDWGWESVR